MFTAAKAIQQRDPAAHSVWEVILTYSGFHALAFYRLAHWFQQHSHHLLAALIAHWGKRVTGVEIHPAAQIGRQVFIDHGTGVVIGETAVIGDRVTILHNVTLGSRHLQAGRRHPVVANDVLIGAGAQLLGAIQIGAHVKIGAGTIVLTDVPAYTTIVGNPGKPVEQQRLKLARLN
ncbi:MULTISPECIES: serine O-acetyltransferase EpsC [Loigolactobacillus]|uniref:Serine acetyltransferase n=1 Tax=Loigolactobacillus backii TaxID=375175 RepID=A0A192H0L0_9LACO|nr:MULTISPECIES: serine O-acetyltransferase EpsC [Loigolactobacillus]ANK60542.1 serine acetyltransferase [Loigolactobacillus backii]ANK61890.1 serine acetyltransferase [Loigolactobacillus backii]ANK65493.1 serine acetyltransferase [Loigolactobacillus backii]ANK67967.1 serine acetyltransferase [Loigolactobacillus backii]ANK68916.1 serine acetyltransferase [Loigolactobacillus backii]